MTKEERKSKIIELHYQGLTNLEIARKLRISEQEVVMVLIKAHIIRD